MPADSSLLSIFLFSFAVGFGAVITPGPVSTAIVSQAPLRGWLVGPLIATGHSFLEFIIVALLALGLGAGLAQPGVQTIIAVAGGILLLFMGFSMIRDALTGKISLPGPQENQLPMSTGRMIGLGVVATITNPFWYAWWVTVAPGYLAQVQAPGAAAVAAFFLGHISADYAWDTFLSAVVGGGKKWISGKVYRGIILACALFFVYLGVQFIIRGFAVNGF